VGVAGADVGKIGAVVDGTAGVVDALGTAIEGRTSAAPAVVTAAG